jgi:phosphoribosylaminoimidazolecarboxamide formyltransferase/IMP cyclohydrolase
MARVLVEAGWRVLSSGGTAAHLAEQGVPAVDVADLTGSGAILGHRVVTLHPAVHAGILADLDDPTHRADLERLGIEPISLVVVNLYPFATAPGVELIDVGGPAMVRGAAKNHAHVTVVVDPIDYGAVADEIRTRGSVSAVMRRRLAVKAFSVTAAYDAAIARWLAGDGEVLPESLVLAARRVDVLRYGENPHQSGARYAIEGRRSWWDSVVRHGGKETSYLNVLDTEAAWRLVHRFGGPACVIVKHANPCGVAEVTDADGLAEAHRRANACDPTSAFGGIVALNRPVDADTARSLAPIFTEVVVAPSFEPEALAILGEKKNLRILSGSPPLGNDLEVRSIDGGLLVQTVDPVSIDRSTWKVAGRVAPTAEQWSDLEFAWLVCAATGSNAIVVAKGGQTLGIGAGQQNRLDSARIAVERAAGRAAGGVAASDAFFPFRDGLDAVAVAGVTAVIEPGGSVRDDEVITAADEHGIALVFTGERHFRH